jgi:hypothetical protein
LKWLPGDPFSGRFPKRANVGQIARIGQSLRNVLAWAKDGFSRVLC